MKRKSLFLGSIALILLILAFVVFTTNSGAGEFGSFEGQTPTAIPPDVLTRIVPSSEPFTPVSPTQTPARPAFDFQQMYPVFPETQSAEQILAGKSGRVIQ